MQFFNLEIVAPAKTTFSAPVKSVTIPGTLGEFQVLYNHAPMIATFEVGKVKIVSENDSETLYATGGGTVEVLNNKVLVLADSIEEIEKIDIDRAKNALERAQKRLSSPDKNKIDVTRAEAALARAMNRIRLTERYSAR